MPLSFINYRHRYGFHVSKRPSLRDTVENVIQNTPFTAFQIYIANGRSKAPANCVVNDAIRAGKLRHKYGLYLCIHGCLLYNLAGSVKHKDDVYFDTKLESTCVGLVKELDIGVLLGSGIVVHIGSCKDKKAGIETISKTINDVLTRDTSSSKTYSQKLSISEEEFKSRRKIILENAASEGNKIGGTLEEISDIIKGVDKGLKNQISVCIDTAHAFGAGIFDWGLVSEVKRFYKDFDEIVGLRYLEVFHLNDSRRSERKGHNAFFGSRKDRHENLGLGYIFEGEERNNGLKEFFRLACKHKIPIIGEPPAKTDGGEKGPGGRRDWGYVCNLLKDEKEPLIM